MNNYFAMYICFIYLLLKLQNNGLIYLKVIDRLFVFFRIFIFGVFTEFTDIKAQYLNDFCFLICSLKSK